MHLKESLSSLSGDNLLIAPVGEFQSGGGRDSFEQQQHQQFDIKLENSLDNNFYKNVDNNFFLVRRRPGLFCTTTPPTI